MWPGQNLAEQAGPRQRLDQRVSQACPRPCAGSVPSLGSLIVPRLQFPPWVLISEPKGSLSSRLPPIRTTKSPPPTFSPAAVALHLRMLPGLRPGCSLWLELYACAKPPSALQGRCVRILCGLRTHPPPHCLRGSVRVRATTSRACAQGAEGWAGARTRPGGRRKQESWTG